MDIEEKQKKENFFRRFFAWRKKCTHNDTIEIFRCYQDRYIELKCCNCGETFLEDM